MRFAVVSSFHDRQERRQHILNANRSVVELFDEVTYLSEYAPFDGLKYTKYIKTDECPTIYQMVEELSKFPGIGVLLNSDIITTIDILKLHFEGEWAATSKRYEFSGEPTEKTLQKAQLKDLGLDVFVMPQAGWARMLPAVPKFFRIGSQLFDNWICAYINNAYDNRAYDFTNFRCIYHPKHEHREYKYSSQIGEMFLSQGISLAGCRLPRTKLSLDTSQIL